MGYKYQIEPAEEGFIERLKYALTADTKISEVVKAFGEAVAKVDDNVLAETVSETPIIKYQDAVKNMEICEFLIREGNQVFNLIASKADKEKISKALADLQKKFFERYNGNKSSRIFAFHDKAKDCKGKPLKELGYTKNNLISLARRTTMLDNQKDLIKKMKKYSGFLASLRHGSESSGGSFIGGILLLTGCVHGYYNFMRRLFFYLGRKFNTQK